MQLFACLFACLCTLAGCQRSSGDPPPPAPASYRSDIESLCDVVARSGAAQLPASERPFEIATWLGSHLATKEAHDYLIRIQPLAGEAKAVALETEARRVGLASCALAAEWRQPAR